MPIRLSMINKIKVLGDLSASIAKIFISVSASMAATYYVAKPHLEQWIDSMLEEKNNVLLVKIEELRHENKKLSYDFEDKIAELSLMAYQNRTFDRDEAINRIKVEMGKAEKAPNDVRAEHVERIREICSSAKMSYLMNDVLEFTCKDFYVLMKKSIKYNTLNWETLK